MKRSITVISKVVAKVTKDALTMPSTPGETRSRPAVRLTGFPPDEVVEIARELTGFRAPGTQGPVTIKVGTYDAVPGLPDEQRLQVGQTLTTWRNRPDIASLVVLEFEHQRDESGLRAAFHSISDRDILGDAGDEEQPDRSSLLAEQAFELITGRSPLPAVLSERLDFVLTALRNEKRAVSLRQWTEFVLAVCEALQGVRAITREDVDPAVGRNLFELGFFPDRLLFSVERAARSRFARNQKIKNRLEEDDVPERIDRAEFDADVLELTGVTDQTELKRRMLAIFEHPDDKPKLSAVEFDAWLWLFEHGARRGLGAMIKDYLADETDRVEEFDDLDVEPGLDRGEQEAAAAMLSAEPPSGLPALVDLLSLRLKRRVEKLAYPDVRVDPDPLRALLHGLHVLSDSGSSTVQLTIDGNPQDAPWTRWLFWLLYGSLLTEVSEQSAGGGTQLCIDERLVAQKKPPLPEEEDVFEQAVAWGPLRLALMAVDTREIRRFRWEPLGNPGIIAFGALLHETAVHVGTRFGVNLEQWCESFADPTNWRETATDIEVSDSIPGQMRQLRNSAFKQLRGGLVPDVIDDYVRQWEMLAEEARGTLVADGAPSDLAQQVPQVVMADVIELPGDRIAMLGTHPLRLRWISAHLRRMTKFISRVLHEDGLRLNPENTELFFDWLDRVSPHGMPPFVVGADEVVALAMREHGWHEEYAAVRKRGQESRDWLSAVDNTAIDEMAQVIISYLDTYPYKRDGLVLVLLSRDGTPRLPLRLVQRVRQRVSGVRIELRLFAPQHSHDEIVRGFEDAFGEEEASDEQLFPDVQLVLKPYDLESTPNLVELHDKVDIALAPTLFGTRTVLQHKTRGRGDRTTAAFDPWLNAATYDEGESTENVVRVLLPRQQDPTLETWSTLCVRHDTKSPVAPQEDTNTDYFSLQVRFAKQQKLFVELHKVAHWVVTLDSFVGRDQIDNLNENDRPDVILVRSGVGKNEAYTLIVSSTTGRRFVVQRLERKLRHDLKVGDHIEAGELADRLYRLGRHVVPGAVLRALGLGRAAHEIVGLVVSRYEVARRIPVDEQRPGMEVWLGFDEHLNWFGTRHRMRADFGRFTFTLEDDGKVSLDLLVVESKYRRTEDIGTAEAQLDRTIQLCRSAFGQAEFPAEDRDFWWQELAGAIDQTSKVEYKEDELPARRTFGGVDRVADRVVAAVRTGEVRLRHISGVAVAIASAKPGHAPPMAEFGKQHKLLRLYQADFENVLDNLMSKKPPTPQASNSAVIDSSPGPLLADVAEVSLTETERGRGKAPRSAGPARGLGEDELEVRWGKLYDTLHQHKAFVNRPPDDPYAEGPGFYVLRVVPSSGMTVDKVVNRKNEIQLALALPRNAQIRTSLDRGAVLFEIPKSPEERYHVVTSELWQQAPLVEGKLVVPVGEDIDGTVVQLDFSSPDSPHLLVAGTTGSGKSVALEGILRAVCRYPVDVVELYLVDPKGTELTGFEDDARTVGTIGLGADDAIDMLTKAVEEMGDRYDKFRELRVRDLPEYNSKVQDGDKLPWRLLVLDEYADLTSDPDDKTEIERLLRRLTQKARAAGIHVIVATQRPSADVVSTTIRSNFPAQLALRVKTGTDSRIIMDEMGAEALAGQGDAFLRTARDTTRLQVARFDE